jgi:hypothetical protein
MAALFCLHFQILYGHTKDISGEFGNSAHLHKNSHTCHLIACVIATILLFIRQCFAVLSNKWVRYWIKYVREETKDMTKAIAHYQLTSSITMSTLQF